jgi:hypothetical protein
MSMREFISGCSEDSLVSLIEAARDAKPVSGFTHNFYRYPARFSPKFVRTAIKTLSEPGELILDPFMGGGTTLVEALALGRHAIGVDISSLAAFVSQVKTTLYNDEELDALERWAVRAPFWIHMHKEGAVNEKYAEEGYYRHMDSRSTWRLRKVIEQSLKSAKRLDSPKLELFARCVILRTGQWALDGRKRIPCVSGFRQALTEHAVDMIEGARELRDATATARRGQWPVIHCLNRSTVGLEQEPLLTKTQKPRLVVSSPPYPGIHVLYHRWQVDGRKETPAPFWIANKLDGSGLSYYTMGDRKVRELKSYFDNLREALRSVAAICSSETTFVQVMAFSEPSWQLARYLSVADDVGFQELFLPNLKSVGDGRLWRFVPNRKWHANQKGKTNGSQEVVLFHRLVK